MQRNPVALLKSALIAAIADRESFAQAAVNLPWMVAETQNTIVQLQSLTNTNFQKMTESEQTIAQLAFRYAERWYRRQALESSDTKEVQRARAKASRYRAVRLQRWGLDWFDDMGSLAPC